ncbi:MAG: hypothetical protein ACJAWL_003114 [Motiliproteus sp.]|jgi:hypothetical protein
MLAFFTTDPQKIVFKATTLEEIIEFLLYIARQRPPLRIQVLFEHRVMMLDDRVKKS